MATPLNSACNTVTITNDSWELVDSPLDSPKSTLACDIRHERQFSDLHDSTASPLLPIHAGLTTGLIFPRSAGSTTMVQYRPATNFEITTAHPNTLSTFSYFVIGFTTYAEARALVHQKTRMEMKEHELGLGQQVQERRCFELPEAGLELESRERR